MRKIVTEGLFTHIEGVFAKMDFGSGVIIEEPQQPGRAKGRGRASVVAERKAPALAHNKRKVKDSRP